jgi:hypothetical protein
LMAAFARGALMTTNIRKRWKGPLVERFKGGQRIII